MEDINWYEEKYVVFYEIILRVKLVDKFYITAIFPLTGSPVKIPKGSPDMRKPTIREIEFFEEKNEQINKKDKTPGQWTGKPGYRLAKSPK